MALVKRETLVKYHPCWINLLTGIRESGLGKVLGGQFDWGGLLPKSNGGVQRSAQRSWKLRVECKSISRLYCKTYLSSSHESGL